MVFTPWLSYKTEATIRKGSYQDGSDLIPLKLESVFLAGCRSQMNGGLLVRDILHCRDEWNPIPRTSLERVELRKVWPRDNKMMGHKSYNCKDMSFINNGRTVPRSACRLEHGWLTPGPMSAIKFTTLPTHGNYGVLFYCVLYLKVWVHLLCKKRRLMQVH
jgi:hypothetical protein